MMPWVERALGWLGVLLLLTGAGWWWLVFGEVIGNQSMTYLDAAACGLTTSDLCSLAEVLCTGWHFLGIKHYSVEPTWVGILLLATRVSIPALRRV